jgi:hypothetical protein
VRQTRILLLAVVLVLAAALVTSGCKRVKLADAPASERGAVDQTQTVPLGEAKSLKADVRMGIGSLKLAAGEPSSTLALDAVFTYPQASWKPEVTYTVDTTQGALSVAQPDSSGMPTVNFGKTENSWRLKLAQGVPTDVSLKLGVGESDIDLSKVDVTSLELISGVGEAKVDLSGPRTHDIKGSIESGVGEVTVIVPKTIGVMLVGGTEGVGELNAPGFTKTDGGMVNSAWSSAGPKIVLTLNRGVGEIRVTSAD